MNTPTVESIIKEAVAALPDCFDGYDSRFGNFHAEGVEEIVRSAIRKTEAQTANDIRTENTRLSEESKQCHQQNDTLVSSHIRSTKIINEIMQIVDTYHEQEVRPEGIGTPGGLEHMGDVWGLFMKWEGILRTKSIHVPNTTAIQEGLQARMDDDENGTLTDNPYHKDSPASIDWYKAYNFVTHDD